MKKIIAGIILCLIVSIANAQDTYQFRYSIFDNYLMNPAYVGTRDYYPILVGRDQRFLGLSEGSPQTYFLSLHSRVGQGYIFKKDGKINEFFSKFGNSAFGFQFTQYIFGAKRETNIGLTYGYHLDLRQSYITRNPRRLILAVTPRFQHFWYNINDLHLIDNEDVKYVDELSKYSTWIFGADVAALYQTVHFDLGAGVLNIQSNNGLESDSLFLPTANDTIPVSLVPTRQLLSPTRLLINGKLKFLDVYTSNNFDVYFIPSFSVMYSPTRNFGDIFVDLMLENTFKKTIAGVRKEIVFTGQLGLNMNYRWEYNPMLLMQPYASFDFKNYVITYAHSFYIGNDLVRESSAFGGFQVSLLFKINRDRIFRESKYNKKLN